MDDGDWLARRFEDNRGHLQAVAYRMLGSTSEADDAVQEAWLRLSRADTSELENLGGWLTTVVARVSLDMLRSRRSRREEPLDAVPDPAGRSRTASRSGDFEVLLALLDPDVVLRADAAVVRTGAAAEVLGAAAVASTFAGRARAARPALVDGSAGAVWVHGGRPRVVFDFTIADGRITAIDMLADADRLGELDLVLDD